MDALGSEGDVTGPALVIMGTPLHAATCVATVACMTAECGILSAEMTEGKG